MMKKDHFKQSCYLAIMSPWKNKLHKFGDVEFLAWWMYNDQEEKICWNIPK